MGRKNIKKPSRSKIVDMSTYIPKTNGKNKPLFIETKRIEMEVFKLLDKHNVPIEEQYDLIHYFHKLRDVINYSEVTNVNKTRKRKKYKVVIAVNGTRKSEVSSWINLEPATDKFNELRKNSENINLPKTHTSHDNKMIPVEYEVYLLKFYEPGDVRRHRRDKMGKIHQEEFFDGNWVILDSSYYAYEETFGVFGYPNTERLDITRIIAEVLPKYTNKYPTKQIYVINHRVIIEYGNKMDIITAFTPKHAIRLYNKLTEVIINSEINTIFCAGKIMDNDIIIEKYNNMQRVTGWNRRKVNRTTTER